MSCQEDVGYEPPPPVKCPCGGCDGLLKMDGFSGGKTKVFLMCESCGHTCYADLMEHEKRHFNSSTKNCFDNECTDDCPVGGAYVRRP